MSDPETRALGRAALLLLLASLVRWGWGSAGTAQPAAADPSVSALLERSQERARSQEVRGRPLAPDERIDPNNASEEELDRLPGIGAATARAIVRSREEEGPFGGLQDLARVKGIGPAALERIAPHLDVRSVPASSRGGRRAASGPPRGPARVPRASHEAIDLNRATPDALETLPGIGPALARRIVAARAEQPFSSVEDLQRVSGIGPATVGRLRPLVVVRR